MAYPVKRIWPRTIGFDGADVVNKTRFAILTVRMLRAYGQQAAYCSLPTEQTESGFLIKYFKGLGIANEALPVLYAADRAEILAPAEEWLAESEKRWLVFDRTDNAGKAYAIARGGMTSDPEWLDALDAYFPEMQVGFYLTRPVEESMQISEMRENSSIDRSKLEVDNDLVLQQGVREVFESIISQKPNWVTVDVSGVASSPEEFARWEKEKGMRIWSELCERLGRPEWLERAAERVNRERAGIFSKWISERFVLTPPVLRQEGPRIARERTTLNE